MWSITPCYKYYLRYHTRLVFHLPHHTWCNSNLLCHTLSFVLSLFKFWQLGSTLVMQRITPGSRLNAFGVFHRFSNPLSPSKINMPRTCTHSYDADNASKRGNNNAASFLLALLVGSQQSSWAAAREKKKVDDDTFAAAGLPQSSWSAVRQKKKVDNDSFAAASTVPT